MKRQNKPASLDLSLFYTVNAIMRPHTFKILSNANRVPKAFFQRQWRVGLNKSSNHRPWECSYCWASN